MQPLVYGSISFSNYLGSRSRTTGKMFYCIAIRRSRLPEWDSEWRDNDLRPETSGGYHPGALPCQNRPVNPRQHCPVHFEARSLVLRPHHGP